MTNDIKRVIPVSIEAEESILGAILFDPRAIDIVKDLLPVEAFYTGGHQTIYKTCLKLNKEGRITDYITVVTALNDADLLEKAGGNNNLTRLVATTISATNLDRYCELVYHKFLSRQIILGGQEIVDLGYDQTESVDDNLERSQRILEQVANQNYGLEMTSNEEASRSAYEKFKQRSPIYPSGFKNLDDMLVGFEPGTLTLLAGRPSMGKSAVALALAFYHALIHKKPVAFFSLEMTIEQLEHRLWSMMSAKPFYKHKGVTPVSGEKMRRYQANLEELTADEDKSIEIVANLAQDLPIFLNQDRGSTVSSIAANCRKLKVRQGELGLIVVDYLQMMTQSGYQNRNEELGAIARGLYKLSADIGTPIIALSQLNRATDSRNDKRPMMSDLSQSGILEMVADNIIFCYRDQYYNDHSHDSNVLELILRKARHGSTGTAKLFFDGEYSKVEDLY